MDKKIASYDIEVSYIQSATWELYDTNVVKVLREPYIMSIAWSWLGSDIVQIKTLRDFDLYKTDRFSDKELAQFIRDEIFDKADVLIAHNGNSFDNKWCGGRFAVHKIPPPSPSQYIDTMVVCKKYFKFPSYSLNNIAKYFGIEEKLSTGGIDLWVDCIENDYADAWERMKRYNVQDVVVLEKVYLHIRPYITSHPNMNLLQGTTACCPNCGSNSLQKRGFSNKGITKRQKYSCNDCGAWSSGEVVKQEGTLVR